MFARPTGATAQDQRKSLRRPVVYRLDVTDRSGTTVGFLVDLSTGGMRLRFSKELTIAEVAELKVELPRWMELGERLVVRGRFAWYKPFDITRNEGGFVFDGLKREARETLAALLERIAEAAVEDGSL